MNRRVLIVDDDEGLLVGLARTHRKHFDITVARSGEEALGIMREGAPFAAVVVDLYMPGMDGLAVLQGVRERHPATSRLMLTGSDDLEIGAEAMESGLIGRYLCKPCPDHAFREALELGIAAHARTHEEENRVDA